jgi:hypothetical protein
MSKYIICQSFKKFHRAVFSIALSFFLGAIHEKHNFKYLKNPTVKVCKIWYSDVYMYILYWVGWGGGGWFEVDST